MQSSPKLFSDTRYELLNLPRKYDGINKKLIILMIMGFLLAEVLAGL